jgi:RNA polymerase sigma factor (sigma-70 family)
MTASEPQIARHALAVYHFGRLQMPRVEVAPAALESHLRRTFGIFRAASANGAWSQYVENLYPLDWFLAIACLERSRDAWDHLFSSRAYRSDCLLIDALRARAVRLYPRNEERQESAVTEFWSQLLVPENEQSKPVLERYDGLRPLVPWLIRVFQNWHVSQLRHRAGMQALPEDDIALPLPSETDANAHWHTAFQTAARECLAELSENELLILGLRMRYRMSQREVAQILGVHEGTVSRQTEKLRDRCLGYINERLIADGWTDDGLFEFVRKEMGSILMDEPRLSADRLAQMLAARGKAIRGSAASG